MVTHNDAVDSIYDSSDLANERAAALKPNAEDSGSIKVEYHEVKSGSVKAAPVETKQPAPKSKAKAKATSKALKAEESEEEDEDAKAAPKANTAVKKTKSPEEQRADNAKKPGKAADSDLSDNVKALLAGSGDIFSGMTVVVTGVPPTLGRKNAEKLVEAYGAKLGKSISKNTRYVVVGNDAGPKKLEQIAELGIETLDEAALLQMVESAASGSSKRAAEEADEKPTKVKKQKK